MNHAFRNSPKKAQYQVEGGQKAIHMNPRMGPQYSSNAGLITLGVMKGMTLNNRTMGIGHGGPTLRDGSEGDSKHIHRPSQSQSEEGYSSQQNNQGTRGLRQKTWG